MTAGNGCPLLAAPEPLFGAADGAKLCVHIYAALPLRGGRFSVSLINLGLGRAWPSDGRPLGCVVELARRDLSNATATI